MQELDRTVTNSVRLELAAIVEHSEDAIIGKTPEGSILTWNAGARKLYGYAQEEVQGRSISILVPPDRSDDWPNILDRIQRGEHVPHYETVQVCKDGRRVDISLTVSPIKDAAGRLIGVSSIARDISQQKHVQEALSLFRALIDRSDDAFFVIHAETGGLVDVNEMACARLGFSRQELLAMKVTDIEVEAYRSRSRNDLTGEIQEKGAMKIQGRHRRKDGTSFPVEVNLRHTARRGDAYLVAVARDITDRVNLEKQLSCQVQFLQALIDAIPTPVFFKDTALKYLGCNAAFELFTGLPRDQLVGKTVYDVLHGELAEMCHEADVLLLRDRHVQRYECSIERTDGQFRNVIFNKAPFCNPDGSLGGLIGTVVDVTELQDAQKEIDRLSHQNRLILCSAGEGILGLDEAGQTVFVNPAAERMLGWNAEDLIGRHHHEVMHHTRPDGSLHPSNDCPIYRAIHGGAVHHEKEDLFWKKDGTALSVEYTSTPICEHGRVTGAVVTFKDITERKQAQEQLTKTIKELEQFNRLAVGRELRMIELKREVNAMAVRAGAMPPYCLDAIDRGAEVPINA